MDLLNKFKSITHIPLKFIIQYFPLLKPRLYSISNSPINHKNRIQICVRTFKIDRSDYELPSLNGVASSYIVQRKITSNVKKSQKSSSNPMIRSSGRENELLCRIRSTAIPFRINSNQMVSHAIIMIAAGVGISPFRGFCEDRSEFLKRNPSKKMKTCLMYYGCRSSNDQLFKDEFLNWKENGIITKYRVAFSRSGGNKKQYVQHLFKKDGKLIWRLITDEKAILFICGKGSTVGKSISESLISIILENSEMNKEEAEAYLINMKSNKQFIMDTWG